MVAATGLRVIKPVLIRKAKIAILMHMLFL